VAMTFPEIFANLTHRSSNEPPDNRSSSCFDEDQTPVWAYGYKDLGTDVRRDPLVRARARVEMPLGRIFFTPDKSSLASGWTWRLAGITSGSRVSSWP
jgi:hypothetical protein